MSMSHDDGCTQCELSGRREFLVRLGSSLAAIGLWLGTPELDAFGTTAISPLTADGARKSYEVPAMDGVRIDKDAEVILVRQQQTVWAFALSCPHQNTALRWNPRDQRFQCPKHKSKYRPDGAFIEGRATRAMDRYGITLEGAAVVVDLDVLHQQDTDAAGWAAASVTIP